LASHASLPEIREPQNPFLGLDSWQGGCAFVSVNPKESWGLSYGLISNFISLFIIILEDVEIDDMHRSLEEEDYVY
jgi:hypothetical protein